MAWVLANSIHGYGANMRNEGGDNDTDEMPTCC